MSVQSSQVQSPRPLFTLQSPSCSQASPAPMKAGKRQLAMSPHHCERLASQAAASAAWGQTWEIRIPVCSAIDSGEANLAWEEMWEVEKGVKLSSSPDGADCQIEEEIVKPEGQQLRCCTLRRRGRS